MTELVKILVVDDDEVDRIAVKRALLSARVSLQMSEASSCAEAIAILQQQQFDCVFLDYLLPDGNAISLVTQVRTAQINVPIVVLTGQGDEQIAVQLMKAGACDYLAKSNISPDMLSHSLQRAIRIHKAETEAALANEKLRESEERYRLVLEAANDGIWDWYCTTDEVYCNGRMLEILGISEPDFTVSKDALINLIHPEDLQRMQTVLQAHLNRGEKCEMELRMRHSSGEYRYCFAKGKLQRDRNGCPWRMSGIVSDITQRKQLEAALRTSEARFRRLSEANIIGIIVADMDGNVIEANNAFLEIIGYSRADLERGRVRWRDMTPPEYQPLDDIAVQELMTTGVMTSFEKEYIRADGSRVPILLGGAILDEAQKKTICFVIDVSGQRTAEAQVVELNRDLERRVSELETLLDLIPIGIAIANDPECFHIRVNPPLAKLLNLPPDANASKSGPPDQQPPYKVYRDGRELPAVELPMQYSSSQGVDILDFETDVVTCEGKPPLKVIVNAAPLFDEQGNPRGSVAAIWDITERKRIEEQQRLLAAASILLASSLDTQETLENLAQLIVPQLADWCSIHIREHDQTHLVTVTHSDPVKKDWAMTLQQLYPLHPEERYGTAQVIRTGQSEYYPEIPDTFLEALAHDADHLQILRDLGLESLMCVPITARGKTLGAINLIYAESGRTYTRDDLALAEDLAQRVGLAMASAQLYQEATDIGENLRQAILILGEQQQQLRVLQQLTNLVNQRLGDLPDLLQVMAGAVAEAIDEAEFCLILLHNPYTEALELTATTGEGAENIPLAELIHPDSGFLATVFETGVSQLLQSQTPPASIYAVAIESAQAGRLGVLAIGNWENGDAFDLEDRNLLSAVGEQAAIAINNARMIHALEERESRLAIQNEILAQQNQQLEQNKQQIQLQNLQLLEAARLKTGFLTTVSHELRTPLNAILGFSQLLLRQRSATLSENQLELVQRIHNSGNNLLSLVNDILDLAKIEAGRLSLQLKEFNFSNLVLTTVSEHCPQAEEKKLSLQLQVNLENSQIVNDQARVKQILVNLLSNAIKFTKTGGIQVTVWEINPDRIVLSVTDTGIGIAESELRDIFEKFRQVDQSITRPHGGTGVGLAIIKSLVDMMQGTISVESKLGEGSTFRVELPRLVSGGEFGDIPDGAKKASRRMLF